MLFSFFLRPVNAAQFRSARRHRNVFGDLRRRVEILSESKAPDQMTVAVVNIGDALALTGRVVPLRTVLETVDRKPSSIDFRNPERRVPCGGIRIAKGPVNASKGTLGSARVENGIRICGHHFWRDWGGADQEGADRCKYSGLERLHGFFPSPAQQK